MPDTTTKQNHDQQTPHIVVNATDTLFGLGIGNQTIVRLKTPGTSSTTDTSTPGDERGHTENQSNLMHVDGTLPENLITNTPHIKTPEQSNDSETGRMIRTIPLTSAPDWYLDRIEKDFEPKDWVVHADTYATCSDAGNMEAVVMALSESIDTVGPGQASRISDITTWSEQIIQDILSSLHLTKYDQYHQQVAENKQI